MSQLGCTCGHVISDGTDRLPYKGYVVRDVHYYDFLGWLVEEAQSYLKASRDGETPKWFLERGYGQRYIDLKLDDSSVLFDRITSELSRLEREVYECLACGRIHIETQEDNRFQSYAPENGRLNDVLAGVRADIEHR